MPYLSASSSTIGIARGKVVTTEKPVAIMLAVSMAASQMPTTGPRAISRQAPTPGSSKQATT